jgi:nicotinamidase-related amidase
MATIREGDKKILLVVDAQAGVVAEAWEASRVVENIGRAVEKARAAGVPVIWVQHADEELVSGSAAWQLAEGLSPAKDEPVVHKQFNSSFEQTTLEETLAALGATHVVLAGAATNWCVRATAYGALDRGYDLTLLKDAHTTDTVEFDGGLTLEAADVVRDLNMVMRWVSYPDRSSSTAAVDEFDFAGDGRS